MSSRKLSRRAAREIAFQLLFAWDFDRERPVSFFFDDFFEEGPVEDAYIRKVFSHAVENIGSIDALIEETALNWKTARMSTVTRTILRLAVGEFELEEAPPKVVINEAIELSKKYDDPAAPSFINGILNRIARDQGRIGSEG